MYFDDKKEKVDETTFDDECENECDKMYGMGSTYELTEEECQYDYLAKKIALEEDPEIKESMKEWSNHKDYSDALAYETLNDAIKEKTEKLVNNITRPDGGYLEQLKRHLNIDLSLFDYSNIRNLRERAKIIFLIYKMKKDNPGVNILEMLSNQSMENIDYSLLKWKTYNGEYVIHIKDELKKEIDIRLVSKIEEPLNNIHLALDFILDDTLYVADRYCSEGKTDDAINYINEKIQSIALDKLKITKANYLSPIETLYFRIKQYEYIGQIKDIMLVNNINYEPKHDISSDMIEEMKELAKCKIEIDEIDSFISDAPKIAKYVYLRNDISANDIKKIRRQKNKVKTMINFLYRATPLKPVGKLLDKLHIISFLQAIILDQKDEIFNYTFYRYQNFFKHKQRVQISINPGRDQNSPVDALKIYWSRKINDHWYANIGRYEIRCKLRELENAYDEVTLKLLSDKNL